jgi:hypothetical protein
MRCGHSHILGRRGAARANDPFRELIAFGILKVSVNAD